MSIFLSFVVNLREWMIEPHRAGSGVLLARLVPFVRLCCASLSSSEEWGIVSPFQLHGGGR